MPENPLAELIPLWRTLREDDTTVLVTPALDYVGCLELGGIDVRFLSDAGVAGVGEALRSFIGGLEDHCSLLFLSRVYEEDAATIAAFEAATSGASGPLREYVLGRRDWLAKQPVRRARLFLFFSQGKGALLDGVDRGKLGLRLVYKSAASLTEEAHAEKVKVLTSLRDRLVSRLAQIGLPSRELELREVWQLHYELLNPSRAKGGQAPAVHLVDNLWSEAFIREQGQELLEYTEAEQLAFEDLEDCRGYFRHGGLFRRVCTLKVLPEGGSDYFSAMPLQSLAIENRAGDRQPFGYTLAVAITVAPQRAIRSNLALSHRLVSVLQSVLPFLQNRTVENEVADQAKQQSITNLFVELNEMATKVVRLSVSLLLEAPSLEQLEERTEVARNAFASAGNSELMIEEVSQLAAFLSMFPGSGPYQLRKKGCTSRNAADFLPVFTPWCGGEVGSLMLTPTGEFFRFKLFDKSFGVNAFHALVAADTGSGKSFSVGALALDALASGLEAILVDNGNSWKNLTELMGGIHIPVDLNTSICPFLAYEHMMDADGRLDSEAVAQVVRFIEVCVTDHTLPSFDLPQRDLVGRAVARCYRDRFQAKPSEKPLLGDFREHLLVVAEEEGAHARDRETAAELHLRLRAFCDEEGPYAQLLNRPSTLRFDSPLLTFEMEKVSKDPLTKKIAMAAVMEAISARAAARRRRAIVVVDEAHEYLASDKESDKAVESFLGGCYAKMRKYDIAMWTISQKFETFLKSAVSATIIGNSQLKLFLWHSSGHRLIGDHFQLPPNAVQAFAGLQRQPGRFSDVFLMYGTRTAVMRLAVHPLAYWILTTDGDDKRLIESAVAKNPRISKLRLLKELAALYPHGARYGARAA